MKRTRDEYGFTLVEVLVAFAVLSLTLLVVFQIYSTGFRGIATADWKLQAVEIAKSKLASTGVETPLAAGTVNGTTQYGFNWQIVTSPFGHDKALFKVDVTVAQGGDPASANAVTLSTLRARTVR